MAQLKITQVRSTIGSQKAQKDTLRALGIRKMNHSVVIEDSKPIRGMVKAVQHLVKVEEVAA